MRLFRDPREFNKLTNRGVYCCIGMFDGVHRGHQHVICKSVHLAKKGKGIALAISFDRHPASIVAPDQAPEMIYSLDKRIELLAETGIDALWLIPFDQKFSKISAIQFLNQIVKSFHPLKLICVGPDFRFGQNRSGNLRLIQKHGFENGYEVPQIEAVKLGEKSVSSTDIRRWIVKGKFSKAREMLGRDYELGGIVMEGQRLGRRLGHPTANLDVAGLILPPKGVYAVLARLASVTLAGVMNIGIRPTRKENHESQEKFSQKKSAVEVHLFDFNRQIYGRLLSLRPIQYLRPERKFPSLSALQTQIQIDCQHARGLDWVMDGAQS